MDTTYLYYYYGFGIIYFFLGILNYLYIRGVQKKTQIQYSKDALANVKKLEQQEPRNKPPLILSIIQLIFSLPLLAFAIFAIWQWSSGRTSFRFDLTILLFSLIFVIFPLYVIVDTFFVEPKRYKLGKSIVAKEANIDFDLDADSAFNRCLNALAAIHANVVRLERPEYMIAIIGKSRFNISLKPAKGHKAKAKANIICDSQWVTVKFDAGANRKYLNQFLMAL
ncbi:MAG: hypothetical protein WBB97_00125 [Dehalococcoidales bacterium]